MALHYSWKYLQIFDWYIKILSLDTEEKAIARNLNELVLFGILTAKMRKYFPIM